MNHTVPNPSNVLDNIVVLILIMCLSVCLGFDEMNRLVREALIANLYTARAVARKHATFQSVYM